MIYKDKKLELENQTSALDYLASFWNPEAVKKVQEIRAQKAAHRFKSDSEFEEHVLSGEYKQHDLLEAVIKMRELESSNNQRLKEQAKKSKTKLPTDLSSIQNTLRKFDG